MDVFEAIQRLLRGEGLTFNNGETLYLRDFKFFHASPPCQAYIRGWNARKRTAKPDLLGRTREALAESGLPWVIENVPGAPMENYTMLCGTMFGLRVIRHRWFECSWGILFPPACCNHNGRASGTKSSTGVRKSLDNFRFITVVGHDFLIRDGSIAMGIDWMTRDELSQAIPPAYTEYIGKQFINYYRKD
jgi:DNA (cytosine-5)-methyltransferase 1